MHCISQCINNSYHLSRRFIDREKSKRIKGEAACRKATSGFPIERRVKDFTHRKAQRAKIKFISLELFSSKI